MFNGFELSEITKYLNNYDFYNFRLVCKYFYNKTYNERIIRKCKAHIMAIKIQRCYKNKHIYVPLKFWFSRDANQSLPLIALQFHPITIDISFIGDY